MKKIIFVLALFASVYNVQAEQGEKTEAPPVPVITDSATGETLEPEVTIVKSERQTVSEYRVNGRLYMVKIEPDAGPAYYLIDTDGDGVLDAQQDEQQYNNSVPQWVIFSW